MSPDEAFLTPRQMQILEFVRLAALSLFMDQAHEQAGDPPASVH